MAFSQPVVSAASILHAPPGFKFRPTDEEIVLHYLRPRAVNAPLPSSFIVDVDVLSHNPWELLPEGSMEKYFFSQRVLKWPLGNQWNRAAGDGHWKTSGKDVPIFCSRVNGGEPLMIGSKKTLVFYHGKSDFGENTEWVMQEYSLVGAGLTPYRVMRPGGSNNFGESSSAAAAITEKNDNLSEALNNCKVPVLVSPDESWVVCRIYKKKKHMPRVVTQVYNIAEGGQVPFYNFLEQGNSKGIAISLTDIPLQKAKDDEEGRDRSTNVEANSSGVGE
ncbi:hypothetical protein GQ55_8G161500 [Panicum hallii var. hallii]|uniref:NAC domain-containing protein n=1 Tax=Panicum hallii var. hallii TaxID=1504633 RepID=A0A2T7CND4_9POAL|nr:hypothetical protein GQ55_8G161500 [Panicum hallii var. hallii]